MATKTKLHRGENWGVFEGANGYYLAAMAADGVSHCQPSNGGDGWSDELLVRLNRAARDLQDRDGTEYEVEPYDYLED